MRFFWELFDSVFANAKKKKFSGFWWFEDATRGSDPLVKYSQKVNGAFLLNHKDNSY